MHRHTSSGVGITPDRPVEESDTQRELQSPKGIWASPVDQTPCIDLRDPNSAQDAKLEEPTSVAISGPDRERPGRGESTASIPERKFVSCPMASVSSPWPFNDAK